VNRRIEILVDRQGGVRIEARGYAGSSCEAATAALEQALGVSVARSPTADRFRIDGRSENVERLTLERGEPNDT